MAGRDWDALLPMFLDGESGFLFQGDWAIGTFNGDGLKEGDGLSLRRAPHDVDEPGFILNSDSVIFFKQKNPDYHDGQELLAHLIMSPEFQTIFNQAKGSIPARMDVDLARASTPASRWRRPTCRRRSRPASWWSAWRTTWRWRRNSGARCSR